MPGRRTPPAPGAPGRNPVAVLSFVGHDASATMTALPAAFAPSAADFLRPPILANAEGRTRTVGVEIEFAGLTALEAVDVLRREFGGTAVERDPHAFLLEGSAVGDLFVELDSRYLHPDKSGGTLLGGIAPALATWLGSAATAVIPCELVTAPVPIGRLHEIDRAVAVLREAGARGTQDGPLYAFGLHFNPEAPRLDAPTIAATLKAFVLLGAWLQRQVAPDATRHALGFADPFPDAYVRRLVSPDYWPTLPYLTDHYLAANATRNRGLDLLPLLAFLDEERVRAALPEAKIRPPSDLPLPAAGRAGERPRLEHRAGLEPLGRRGAAGLRPRAPRRPRRGLSRLHGDAKGWAEITERIALA
jgi:hypothetical protein